jgi:two-component system response regulator ResD
MLVWRGEMMTATLYGGITAEHPRDDHVLVISSDIGFAESAGRTLRRSGAHVQVLASAGTALEALSAQVPDLAIIDLDLPDVSGVDLCRRVRLSITTPIIAVGGSDGDELDGAIALEVGADSFHEKPIGPRHLASLAKAFLRRSRSRSVACNSARLRVGPLVVEPVAREAWLHGETLALAPKECALLAALAREPGRVLSRDALARELWDDGGSASRLLSSHLSRLRRKLAVTGEGQIALVTVPSLGYALHWRGG